MIVKVIGLGLTFVPSGVIAAVPGYLLARAAGRAGHPYLGLGAAILTGIVFVVLLGRPGAITAADRARLRTLAGQRRTVNGQAPVV